MEKQDQIITPIVSLRSDNIIVLKIKTHERESDKP